jgi:hypothetical protein
MWKTVYHTVCATISVGSAVISYRAYRRVKEANESINKEVKTAMK